MLQIKKTANWKNYHCNCYWSYFFYKVITPCISHFFYWVSEIFHSSSAAFRIKFFSKSLQHELHFSPWQNVLSRKNFLNLQICKHFIIFSALQIFLQNISSFLCRFLLHHTIRRVNHSFRLNHQRLSVRKSISTNFKNWVLCSNQTHLFCRKVWNYQFWNWTYQYWWIHCDSNFFDLMKQLKKRLNRIELPTKN